MTIYSVTFKFMFRTIAIILPRHHYIASLRSYYIISSSRSASWKGGLLLLNITLFSCSNYSTKLKASKVILTGGRLLVVIIEFFRPSLSPSVCQFVSISVCHVKDELLLGTSVSRSESIQ